MPAPKEKGKSNRHMDILTNLLQVDENKSCSDCETRGPRWASWNLGVFLCIRCAGIHRNLGVHISRVKSVNLDSWTTQQVARMQDIGNGLARKVYEAHLPENFRRPQTDSALEQFIRAKYQDKRYIDREWKTPVMRDQPSYGASDNIPTQNKSPLFKQAGDKKLVLKNNSTLLQANDSLPHTQSSPCFDLLNLDTEEKQAATNTTDNQGSLTLPKTNLANKSPSADDLFGDFVSSTVVQQDNKLTPAGDKLNTTQSAPQNKKSGYWDLSGLDFSSGPPGFGNFTGSSNSATPNSESTCQAADCKPKSSKESILALYASCNVQPTQSFNQLASIGAQQNQNVGRQQFGQFNSNQFEQPPPNYMQHQLLSSSTFTQATMSSAPASGANSQLLLGELGGTFNTSAATNPNVGQNGVFGLQHNPFFASSTGESNQSGFNQQNMSSMFSGLQLNSASQANQFSYNSPANNQSSAGWPNAATGQTFATNLWQ